MPVVLCSTSVKQFHTKSATPWAFLTMVLWAVPPIIKAPLATSGESLLQDSDAFVAVIF